MKLLLLSSSLCIALVACTNTGSYSARGKVYTVRKIDSHYPDPDQNTQTTLIVYKNGSSGHTEEILCLFPPGFLLIDVSSWPTIPVSNKRRWIGINKVRVGSVAKEFAYGITGYYCEKVK